MARRIIRVIAALAFVMSALAATGAQAAQPAAAAIAPWHYPNPSIAVSSSGEQFVFWQGVDGDLWEAWNDGSWHGPLPLPHMGQLGSPPGVAVIGTTVYVVWKGTDNALWLGYWASGWHGPSRLGFGPLGSKPSIYADQSNVLTAVWGGTDGALWYAFSPHNPGASGWSGPHSLGHGPLGSSPSATGHVGGQYLDAGWAGAAPQRDLWWRQGNGFFQDLGFGPLDSPPTIVTLPTGNLGTDWVGFWAGTDSNLWFGEWQYTLQTNTTKDISGPLKIGLGPLGGAPSAAFEGTNYYVVWEGTDLGLWDAIYNLNSGVWTLHEVPGMGPL